MSTLLDQLLGRARFPRAGSAVDCAVSGGPDSTALLILAVHAGCSVTAHHVDHGLRPGSAGEAELVARAAERLGAAFRSARVDISAGGNLAARAREARYRALPAGVLTGHTADDQAETVLLNLVRGAGLDGAAGMRADERRPLLDIRRNETARLCAEMGFVVVDDPGNLDPARRRNRLRHEVIPLLGEIAERDVVPLVSRHARLAREAVDHLDTLTAGVDPTDCAALTALAPVLARRVVRSWLRSCSPAGHPPDAATVDRVLAVAAGQAVGTDVSGGWQVRRSRGVLRIEGPGEGAGTGL